MGPLNGLRIVELAGIGPAPFAAMTLADLGATVLRIDRPVPGKLGIARPTRFNLLLRNRQNLALDLKSDQGRELVLQLLKKADGLIEGFRPGVTERLGLGPDECLACNPRLVYGRMTGWGQQGPLSQTAGHDLNYIALTGVMDWIGREGQPPTPPLNLIGDYAGGGLYLALGMVSAILEARQSGRGQVVDAAIVDGTAALATSIYGLHSAGMLGPRGTNTLDSGAPFYEVYQCADGKWISVAPIEPKFYEKMCCLLEVDPKALGAQMDKTAWPKAKELLGTRFKTRTRDEWCRIFEGSDACVAPLLTPDEAMQHSHLAARQTFVSVDGVTQPAPAPRFSRSTPNRPTAPADPDREQSAAALTDWLGEELATTFMGNTVA